MNGKKNLRNEQGLAPCKYCKSKGEIVYPEIRKDANEEIWYAVCPKCHKFDTYDFIAINKTRAKENWNSMMENNHANYL